MSKGSWRLDKALLSHDRSGKVLPSPPLGSGTPKLFIWPWFKTALGSHFGVGAPHILVYFSGDWDVHWGYGMAIWGYVIPKN